MNNSWLIFLVVFVSLISGVCTGLLVPLRQRYLKIDPELFKRVKVKFPSFLFAGIGDKKTTGNVKNFGVIVPMFVLHIVGYLVTAGMWVTVPLLYQYGVELSELWAAPVVIALVYTIAVVIAEAVLSHLSAKRAVAKADSGAND